MNRDGSIEEFEKAMEQYKIGICAMQEVRWLGMGIKNVKNGSIYYSGRKDERKEEGVGIYIQRSYENSIIEFENVSSRIARMRLRTKWMCVSVIAAYAPTEVSEEQMKDEWYALFESTLNKVPNHDMMIILGDLNAKVGREVDAFGPAIGMHSLHADSNNNGVRLASLALQYDLVVGGTLFPHKDIHKGTWVSPGGQVVNQIDHALIRRKFRSAMSDVRVFRGAECDSDHMLLVTNIRVKLNRERSRRQLTQKIDVGRLKDEAVKQDYQLELRNRFGALEVEDIGWQDMKNIIDEVAEDKIGRKQRRRRNNWYDLECESAAGERNASRIKWIQDKHNIEKREEYCRKRRIAKRVNRRKKRLELDTRLNEIEVNRRNNMMKEQFKGIKNVKQKYQAQKNLVKSEEGVLLVRAQLDIYRVIIM